MKSFQDRKEAGVILSETLLEYATKNPLILALPRGGLAVAAEVAQRLRAPLDILAVKKIGAPKHPELAIGAISEDGVPVLNEGLLDKLDPDRHHLKKLISEKQMELKNQVAILRDVMPIMPVKGRVVILVDDGMATGATMRAAVMVLKGRGAAEIVVATPVSSPEAYKDLQGEVDHLVSLLVPPEFFSVGLWYHDFSEVSDEEAIQILKNQAPPPGVSTEMVSWRIPGSKDSILGELTVPRYPKGIILFLREDGSRFHPRNLRIGRALQSAGFATLIFDALMPVELKERKSTFDIDLLAERCGFAKSWVRERYGELPVGYFAMGAGAAAAIQAIAEDPQGVFAMVSWGGRPDLALASLGKITVPVLLLVGGEDASAISLNRGACDALEHGRVVVISGAGRLLEKMESLNEVVEYTLDWAREHLPGKGTTFIEPKEEFLREAGRLAKPLTGANSLRVLAKDLAKARVVMLGEATHGTKEFYAVRRELSKILIADHGFNFIAVEGDWPDCYEIHRFIHGKNAKGLRLIMEDFRRWPSWMWANSEVMELVQWMKNHRSGFYGLDVYSLFESIGAIRKVAMRFGTEMGSEILRRYSCFEPYERNEIKYAKSLFHFSEGCENEAVQNLQEILTVRLEETRLTEEELFSAQQNARVIKNAESYYRAMLKGEAASWNIRDHHMLEVLTSLLRRHGDGSKAIVWAHNTHIGDYRATDMVDDGYVNLGGLTREQLGADQVALVGFGTYGGELRAGRSWGAREEVLKLPDAKAGSVEEYLHKLAKEIHHGEYYLLFDSESRKGALARRKGHRAVGVVYSPSAELKGRNYVPTELARRYDAFVFVDRTTALSSFKAEPGHGLMPETWPSGQ